MDAGGASMNKLTVELQYPVNEIVNHREHILHIRKSALGKKVLDKCLLMPIMYICKQNPLQEGTSASSNQINFIPN